MGHKQRKQYRLPGYDYSAEGKYFVTICTSDRIPYFGEIENASMIQSEMGSIADKIWNEMTVHYPNVKLDQYQIMPDHFHGILILKNTVRSSPLNKMPQDFKARIANNPMELKEITLGRIIRWFKGRVKYEAGKLKLNFNWQARFYDRIVRDDKELYFIREYIINNPANWGRNILRDFLSDESEHHK